ncbi:glycosyltransferase family 4 protein [Salisediminibacterium selenitireducens]|uniref:Glycosyl transferase group 1 n=1 Tax=Bacillus selenitireducens (strain ATCC 700615 / DSM 15326 / MLS10) TaxID=439292 RepID=D6Y025_BACIE|nr:glycosyltransferase family 4 protein [Salisediminibacterium selenitireducens]ADI00527.1 glycosyl transferase group 1 [[Bacillus] selenitireducens MLS10]
MKKVVILSNHHAYTYNFRREIIQRLIDEKFQVYVIQPYGEKVEKLKEMGCECIDLPLDRRGTNPITDAKLIRSYFKLLRKIRPNVVLSYTVKPNVYGGFVCRLLKIPHIPNITGLGTAVEKKSFMQKVMLIMHKVALKKSSCIMFQNEENKNLFEQENIRAVGYRLIPGSGVNTKHFSLLEYPIKKTIEFVFISRIMKEKGIDQYLEAAEYIRGKHPETKFHICGFCEDDYEDKLKELEKKGVIKYHGMVSDIREILKITHCTVHPTYYPEGMSNVLLESAASGRPIITTNRSGCREIVDNGINGYVIEQENSLDLIDKIEKFISLNDQEKLQMGLLGRKKVEEEFDRALVVDSYLKEIKLTIQ